MQNLIEYLRELKDPNRPSPYTPERITALMRSYIRDNIKRNQYWSSDRLGFISASVYIAPHVSRIKARYELKKFGSEIVREAKRIDDHNIALEYLNGIMPNWIRDRFDFVEVMDCLFGGYFYRCNDCDVIEHEDSMTRCYDDYYVCESCADNYRYSDRRDTYISEDDYYEEQDEDEEDSVIHSYHYSKNIVGHIPSEFDKRKKRIYLGLELEMEVRDDYSRMERAEYLHNHLAFMPDNSARYCAFENDGSLNDGFEMVTGYTGLDVHKSQLAFFKNPVRGLRSHDTSTCGLHVHICKSDMTLLHASKMILFIHESSNQRLIRTLARRDSSRFAQIKNKKASYDWLKEAKKRTHDPISNLNSDRYEALNFQNENTVEFRLFKGTLKYETIMACLEFTYATWFFTRDASVSDLTSQKFIEHICKPENRRDTVFLRQYLREKGFDLPKSALVKSNPRIEEARADFAEV